MKAKRKGRHGCRHNKLSKSSCTSSQSLSKYKCSLWIAYKQDNWALMVPPIATPLVCLSTRSATTKRSFLFITTSYSAKANTSEKVKASKFSAYPTPKWSNFLSSLQMANRSLFAAFRFPLASLTRSCAHCRASSTYPGREGTLGCQAPTATPHPIFPPLQGTCFVVLLTLVWHMLLRLRCVSSGRSSTRVPPCQPEVTGSDRFCIHSFLGGVGTG